MYNDVKEFIKAINRDKVLNSPVRLAVMLFLLIRGEAFFNELVNALGITPGNLWSHLKKLDEENYIVLKRVLTTRPRVKVAATEKGIEKTIEFIKTIKKIADKIK